MTKVTLHNVRLSFPNIYKADARQNDKGVDTYGCDLLMDKRTKQGQKNIKLIEDAMKAEADAKWGGKAPDILDGLKENRRTCLREGVGKAKYNGYDKDSMFVSANKQGTPPMVGAFDGSPAYAPAKGTPYSGCYVTAVIEVWAQDNGYGQRVNAELRVVKFFKDGDSFGGSAPVGEDELEGLPDGELDLDDDEDTDGEDGI